MMKRYLFIILLLISFKNYAADNSRSDTIDITHYHITLDIIDYNNKVIGGNCEIQFKSKLNNINSIDLDLLKLNIDSITQNNQVLNFTYDSLLIKVQLLSSLNINDSSTIKIYYHGNPKTDPYFGGFYFDGSYAYNMGVAFNSLPHNFGRVWFPCFDNFVERSTYSFSITIPTLNKAVCNGLLESDIDNGNGFHTMNWNLNQTIPTYLACVAINSYIILQDTYSLQLGLTPVELAVLAADSNKIIGSFINLENAVHIFEDKFGPYQWDKIGYVGVPFNYGAMEHATMVSYPLGYINGNISQEGVMAHELSHHWFGDLVTCETAEDMWLNEGWADFSSKIFTEEMYGKVAYMNEVDANHAQVIQYAHTPTFDSSYYALNNVPQNFTYGLTSYNKGADIAHTLRGYMGDSLFFHCIKNYLTAYSFQSSNSYKFRDFLSNCSGIDLTDFFTDWVMAPGFADFNIDSFYTIQNGSFYNVQVFVRQKLNHAPHYYHNVPLELYYMDSNFDTLVKKIMLNGSCGVFSFTLPFNPLYIGLDLQNKISDSQTGDSKIITSTGSSNFIYGKMSVNVLSNSNPSYLRIEHHYAPPDAIEPTIKNLHVSDYRYWKVDGILASDFDATAVIQFNGTLSASGGCLDNTLITNVDDSVRLLYRKGVHDSWKIETDVVRTIGLASDKKGSIKINHLKKGEYALAIYDYTKIDSIQYSPDSCLQSFNFIKSVNQNIYSLRVDPSVSNHELKIYGEAPNNSILKIYNSKGIEIFKSNTLKGKFSFYKSAKDFSVGMYIAILYSSSEKKSEQKFIITQ